MAVKAMSRTIAIGDIHGCLAALDALLERIQPAASDTIIFLGDYIDRGPDSAGVINRVLDLQEECNVVALHGNHEAMLMMARIDSTQVNFWLTYGGRETLESYGGDMDDIPDRHIEFFEDNKLYHETENYFFVHANYTPSLPLDAQPEYALLWEHLHAHLPEKHISGKRAVIGHTPQPNGDILVLDQLICIDTHCYGGGYLTALDVDNQTIWQADADGVMRDASSASEASGSA